MTKKQNQSQLITIGYFSKRKRKAVKLEYPTITISENKFQWIRRTIWIQYQALVDAYYILSVFSLHCRI